MHSDLLSDLKSLTEHHSQKCETYKAYINALFPDYAQAVAFDELPWLPVRAFKQFDLLSIPNESIFKTMHSSGTGGVQSRIYLDQETAKLQQAKLIEVFQTFFGKARFPMLVIDAESTVKNRKKFSARTAAINGFSIFSRGREFALNEDLDIDIQRVQQFLEKYSGKQIFIFGFTFIVWEKFIERIEELELDFDFSNAFLVHGGGWKKLENKKVSSEVFRDRISKAINCSKVHNYYGMIEQTGSIYMECPNGHLHAPSGADVLIRGREDFLRKDHSEEGLIHLFSNIQRSYPGHSLLTEDIGYTLPASTCDCGHEGTILKVKGRLEKAEVRGCSDAVNR
ncbi:acyl-protein synthetase [Neptuniibacter sp. SY11_33]|uniref:LuxE/PaaK family acyltransferase n=1 Tax=Neptuniibacter sp. SY11_33 TaxID=3398215 RepID=UPI0039F5F96C